MLVPDAGCFIGEPKHVAYKLYVNYYTITVVTVSTLLAIYITNGCHTWRFPQLSLFCYFQDQADSHTEQRPVTLWSTTVFTFCTHPISDGSTCGWLS